MAVLSRKTEQVGERMDGSVRGCFRLTRRRHVDCTKIVGSLTLHNDGQNGEREETKDVARGSKTEEAVDNVTPIVLC